MNDEDSENGVNRSPVNRRASPGSQEVQARIPGGRYQASGQEEEHQDTTTRDRHQRRRKWSKADNIELWKCYLLSDPQERGYRRRMTTLWHERGNHDATEQRIADQQRAIIKRNWLSETEREEIRRKIEDPEEAQEDQGELPSNSTYEPVNNLQPQSQEEMVDLTDKLMQYATTSPRRLPSLKGCNPWLLKERTKEVDQLLSTVNTNNITETNALIYAGARLVTELMGKKTEMSPNTTKRNNIQPAKRRVMQQIDEMRKHLAWIEEIINGKLKKENNKDTLERRYNLTERGTAAVKEDIKQRIRAKASTMERFEARAKSYNQNRLFNTNQRRLYEQLRQGGPVASTIPEVEPTKRYWENIWSNPVSHRKDTKWVQEVKNDERDRVKQQEIVITVRKVREQLRKVPNWKAPGPDCVQGYWLKNFKSLHGKIAQQLQDCMRNKDVPEWMTTGRTALIQKDQEKGNIPSNYRPITCLPVIWKLLTGIISEELYVYLEETNSLPKEQKGCRRHCRGTKDHLLVDKMIMRNCKRRKTNLSMAWIDYKKAFDMVPHSWIIECLKIYGAADNLVTLLSNTMKHWKTTLTASGTTLAEVNIRRGIFQGDSLSPLLFIVSMIPMTMTLRKTGKGYQLGRQGIVINHLMFMDDIKIYGKDAKSLEVLVQTIRIITEDMRMEFGIEKCGMVNIVKGKTIQTEGIRLPDDRTIIDIGLTPYKYLGILESDNINHQEMKSNIKKEYLSRIKAILKSKLNSGNTVKAMNTWAVPVVRYSAGIVDWTKEELENMDRKTRKLMTINKALHPRASVARLYIQRNDGGRGIQSVEECVNLERRALGQYLKHSEDQWLTTAWNEKVISVDEDPEMYKRRVENQRKEEWKNKPMQGQYLRQTQEIAQDGSWQWITRGELKKETEGMLMAAQDQALRTRYIQNKIDGQASMSPMCRKCEQKMETINHVISECPALAQNEYKRRHDIVAKTLHWKICKEYNIPCPEKWYNHIPEKVVENDRMKILWDYDVRTDHVIQARRPDLILINKVEQKVSLIDVAIPWDTRVKEKSREKIEKYHDLKMEIGRLWKAEVQVVPIILGALGVVPDDLKRNLEKVGCTNLEPGLLQKSVLLATARIIRRVMDA